MNTHNACTISAFALLLASALPSQSLQLTSKSGGGERQPVVSADNGKVAYAAFHNGTRELFSIGVDGGTPKRLTTGKSVRLGWGTLESWPSLSISDHGRYITYWNAKGVHVVDTIGNTDRILDAAYQNPYPQISGDGKLVVFQKWDNGAYEVFSVPTSGGTPTRLTTKSGDGYRLPMVRGKRIVYQKNVGNGQYEVFSIDLNNQNRQTQLTTGSSTGNRYARISFDHTSVVYEATVALCRQVMSVNIASKKITQVTQLKAMGDRNPWSAGDGEVAYQSRIAGMALYRSEQDGSKSVVLAKGLDGGLRRVSTDRHGHVVVYQARDKSGVLEVFRMRYCSDATLTNYGTHGKPSIGKLASNNRWYRCTLRYELGTSYGSTIIGVFNFGLQRANASIPNAPGNTLYAVPMILTGVVPKGGSYRVDIPVPTGLKGSFYTQWLMLDRQANARGIVASEGTQTTF